MEKPRKIIPPVYLLSSIVLMFLLDWLVPVEFDTGPIVWGFGGCLIGVGIFLEIASAILFKKANTPLIPFHQTTFQVESGPYKFTRNPMYLGMVFMQIGVAFILGSLLAVIPLTAFVLIIKKHFIEGEERFMEELFGEQYLNYKSRVRRWL